MNSDTDELIIAVIRSWQRKRGYPPTIREIAADVGLSPGHVQRRLIALEAEGLIERNPNQSRTVRAVGKAREVGNL